MTVTIKGVPEAQRRLQAGTASFFGDVLRAVSGHLRESSPVDTGYVRGNWFWSQQIQHELQFAARPNAPGSIPPSQWLPAASMFTVAQFMRNPVFYVQNHTPYIYNLNYGNFAGRSTSKPNEHLYFVESAVERIRFNIRSFGVNIGDVFTRSGSPIVRF